MTADTTEERIELQTEDGIVLEAVIDAPKMPRAAIVLCHPHPKMGGTMNAPLLEALCGHLVGRGWTVLRFNFRGIGASQGESATGIEEVADARAAIAEARRRWPEMPVAIAGWSFGASVAVRAAAEDPDLAACVAVAPAVTGKAGVTAGLPDPPDVHLAMPALFVLGANDDVVSPDEAEAWARAQGISVVSIPGANHLFWSKYDTLTEEIGNFLEQQLV